MSGLSPLGAISRAVNEAIGRALALGDPALRRRNRLRPPQDPCNAEPTCHNRRLSHRTGFGNGS